MHCLDAMETRKPGLERLTDEILRTAGERGREKIEAWKNPGADLRKLAHRDYVRSLRKVLQYRDLLRIVSAAERVWPNLNREQLNTFAKKEFGRRATRLTSDLEVHLKAEPYRGPEGLALRGFYVETQMERLHRPLIYINTAHHPGAISATFCHEVGHHLTARLFDTTRQGVHFFFDADYTGHLDDPLELAADVLVSLAGYPAPIARAIFSAPWNWGLVAKTGELTEEVFADVRKHAEGRFGLNFKAPLPAKQRLNYLAGMIHYAKLRWALLAEYDL
jgi:hypothetical protein